jgi:zinc D-Ala-D-Ala carboxypeptidase
MRTIILAVLVLCLGGGALAYAVWPSRTQGSSVTVTIDSDERATKSIDAPAGLAAQDAGNSVTAPGFAQTVPEGGGATAPVCAGQPPVSIGADGRLFGHFAYAEASAADLVAPPKSFQSGNCTQIERGMAQSLSALIAAATKDDAAVGKALMGVSCFRSVERQSRLFCRPDRLKERGMQGQAKWVAPPGYSEHATGYAIDFGARSIPSCHANPCFKETRTGKWLAANARHFGFEMSFPEGNAQGVSFEPWHFRWIGTGQGDAPAIFNRARSAFP